MKLILHDIFPHRYYYEGVKTEAQDGDFIIIIQEGKIFLRKEEDKLSIPAYKEINSFFPLEDQSLVYVFSIDNDRFFLVLPPEGKIKKAQGYEFFEKRILLSFEPSFLGFGAITACHIYEWYRSNYFCGVCGNLMQQKEDERALICDNCGFIDYPKIAPAIIVGIIDGDKLLMTKYANREYTRYALIAGFTEIGESLEETVRREVMEEVGLQVKDIRYFGSQPWAFSQSLLIGFFAQLDGDNKITLDTNELAEAAWLKREELEDIQEDPPSLTATIVKAWKDQIG